MLAVLSEVNCLENLKNNGIYPDLFYTDFNLFKNQVITLKDVTIVVILAGTCVFNKRHTVEFCKVLRQYRRDANMSIRHVYIISDSVISNLDNYFLMDDRITNLIIMNGIKKVEQDKNLINKLQSLGKKDTKIFLSDFDKGEDTKLMKNLGQHGSTEDDYIKLIQVPNVKEMLASVS